jgi:hypothetical protein
MKVSDSITAILHICSCVIFGAGAWLLTSPERANVFFGGFTMAMMGTLLIRNAVEMGIKDARR